MMDTCCQVRSKLLIKNLTCCFLKCNKVRNTENSSSYRQTACKYLRGKVKLCLQSYTSFLLLETSFSFSPILILQTLKLSKFSMKYKRTVWLNLVNTGYGIFRYNFKSSFIYGHCLPCDFNVEPVIDINIRN